MGGAALEGKIRLRHAHIRMQHFHFETYKSATIGFRPFQKFKNFRKFDSSPLDILDLNIVRM